MPYLVKSNYNGLLAANKNALDLSRKIEILLNDQDCRDKLSVGAKETARKFNSTSDFLSGVENTMNDYIHDKQEVTKVNKERSLNDR